MPSLATNVGAIPEVVTSELGVIVEESSEGIAMAIRQLYYDAEKLAALKKTCGKKAASYSWEKPLRKLSHNPNRVATGSLMKGSIVNIVCQFVKLGFQFLYFTIAAKMLGADKFGLWASVSALCNILSPLIILGIGPCIIKVHASDKDFSLFRSYYYLGALLLAIGTLVLTPVAALLYKTNYSTVALVLIAELFVFRQIELLSQMYLAKEINWHSLYSRSHLLFLNC